jgi:hypothetical protein
LNPGERAFLDLGRVEVIADIRVNGLNAGRTWMPPHRVDISGALRAGTNDIEVDVTTLLTNRLIGDAQMPSPYSYSPSAGNWIAHDPGPSADDPERVLVAQMIDELPEWYRNGDPAPKSDRVTFSSGLFYAADEPLVDTGLLGPVRIVFAVQHAFE